MLRLAQRRIVATLHSQCSRTLSNGVSNSLPFDAEEDLKDDKPRQERGMNKVQLIGRVGKVPDHRGTDEHPCIVFPLATNQTFRKASTGEHITKTDWHRICVFRPGLRDHVAARVSVGDRLYVEGALSYQRYTDGDRPVNITSILADDIMIIARRKPFEIDDSNDEY